MAVGGSVRQRLLRRSTTATAKNKIEYDGKGKVLVELREGAKVGCISHLQPRRSLVFGVLQTAIILSCHILFTSLCCGTLLNGLAKFSVMSDSVLLHSSMQTLSLILFFFLQILSLPNPTDEAIGIDEVIASKPLPALPLLSPQHTQKLLNSRSL